MYRDIICFNNGGMIFKHISDISIYMSVSHSLIYLWRLTQFDLTVAFNKHEHCMLQNQNAARVICMNISLKGTDCLQNSFDGIFILSDKVAS